MAPALAPPPAVTPAVVMEVVSGAAALPVEAVMSIVTALSPVTAWLPQAG